ncbi:M28 family metallopeptidase [Pimelobacter simplex]|uniref:M28 family metallopeptidase n=1 Tax=Nocardioides simplex TaxID=2045 RepID=UPI00214F9055|nr:M28 family metallopeptidase [Pimelobacter simplex]UUW88967.1 M28 family metallopeptidase [Pimelobacter simplex]UUW98472.1 M28 family metallopeptidase [Pimelobacter simplex]
MPARTTTSVVVLAAFLAGCSAEPTRDRTPPPKVPATAAPTPTTPAARPATFDPATAYAAVRHLSVRIGPRLATGPGFRRAADWAAGELEDAGYQVSRQGFAVPAGDSWGVPVRAGRSQNVVAVPRGFDPGRPHLVLGAHLDTVAVSPGAEDNASGVGVLLALARTDLRARLPVVLVLFGAEEPRGTGDGDHHYGSRYYVAGLTAPERRAVRGMLALDRVGVGVVVPVGSATADPPAALVRAARRAGVPHAAETGQRSSDHWSFVRAGLPGLRVGSTPYAGYHNARDLPGLVDAAQLDRVGRLVLAWLRG